MGQLRFRSPDAAGQWASPHALRDGSTAGRCGQVGAARAARFTLKALYHLHFALVEKPVPLPLLVRHERERQLLRVLVVFVLPVGGIARSDRAAHPR